MEALTPKERAVNFSLIEKQRFRHLLEKYKEILFTKKTDNVTNIKKNKAWLAIHAEFNAGTDQLRTIRQLKAKFDNMKRNTRKPLSISRPIKNSPNGAEKIKIHQVENEEIQDTHRDEAALFGEYIASKIRKFDPITTSAVQHHIQNIMYQAELGVYAQKITSVFLPDDVTIKKESSDQIVLDIDYDSDYIQNNE